MNPENNNYNRIINSARNEQVPFSSEQLKSMVTQLPTKTKRKRMLPIIFSATAVCAALFLVVNETPTPASKAISKDARTQTLQGPISKNNVASTTTNQGKVLSQQIVFTDNIVPSKEPAIENPKEKLSTTSHWNPLDIRNENVVMLNSLELAELGVIVTDSSLVIAGEEYYDGKVHGNYESLVSRENTNVKPVAITDNKGILVSSAHDVVRRIALPIMDSLDLLLPALNSKNSQFKRLDINALTSLPLDSIVTRFVSTKKVIKITRSSSDSIMSESEITDIDASETESQIVEKIMELKNVQQNNNNDTLGNSFTEIIMSIGRNAQCKPEGNYQINTDNELVRNEMNNLNASNSSTWIAIRYRSLKDEGQTTTPDLTLWYEPTTEFLERLPEQMRKQIQLELDHKAPSCNFTTLCSQEAGSFALTTVNVLGSTQQIDITLQSEINQPVTIELYNSVGELLSTQPSNLQTGLNSTHLPIPTNNSGVALVVVRNNQNQVAVDRVWLGK